MPINTNGKAIPDSIAIAINGVNFLIHLKSIFLTLIDDVKFLLFKIPTNVIKKIKAGVITTETNAPSILF